MKLSDHEEIIFSEGKVLIVNFKKGSVSKLNRDSRRTVLTNFPRESVELRGRLPVVRVEQGRIVCFLKETGEFRFIQTGAKEVRHIPYYADSE